MRNNAYFEAQRRIGTMMNEKASVIVETMEDLKNYVYSTIYADQELLEDAFPRSLRLLKRSNGELCGAIFSARGPRSVDFTAVWDREKNRVFFYGSDGERYRLSYLSGKVRIFENIFAE